jgi:hypothetical protein
MPYLSPFPYSAADYRARKAGLTVLGCHYATLPDGCATRDYYGNPVQAQRVWIGSAALGRVGIGSAAAAYGTVVQSIHCLATPDLGTVLANIRRALLTVREFPTEADYVAAMLPYAAGADPLTVANAWTAEADCAGRATRTLPADLIDWLVSIDCARW